MTPRRSTHSPDADIAAIAAVIGEPNRAAMLVALMDGRDRVASELAAEAGISPQAATAHLRKLTESGLLVARDDGRSRVFNLASPQIAYAIEALQFIAPAKPILALDQQRSFERLRRARSCYDHLAGQLGVRVTDALIANGALRKRDNAYVVPAQGAQFWKDLGVDVEAARAQRRAFASPCNDWTERRPHLAGSLGAAMLDAFFAHRWVARAKETRALLVTDAGARDLRRYFAIDL